MKLRYPLAIALLLAVGAWALLIPALLQIHRLFTSGLGL